MDLFLKIFKESGCEVAKFVKLSMTYELFFLLFVTNKQQKLIPLAQVSAIRKETTCFIPKQKVFDTQEATRLVDLFDL